MKTPPTFQDDQDPRDLLRRVARENRPRRLNWQRVLTLVICGFILWLFVYCWRNS